MSSVFGNAYDYDDAGTGAPAGTFVDHNYGGENALSYQVNGEFLGGVDIMLFREEDFSLGRDGNDYVIGVTRQLPDGSWASGFYLEPGAYIIRCYKAKVAGPDHYSLTVT